MINLVILSIEMSRVAVAALVLSASMAGIEHCVQTQVLSNLLKSGL
jgi:hypothetical protein